LSIFVSLLAKDSVLKKLESENISYAILTDNISDPKFLSYASVNHSSTANFDYERYNSIEQIDGWVDGLQTDYPGYVSVFEIGKSYESKPIRGVKIAVNSSNSRKPAVFIEAGIHAREWLTTATALYIAKLVSRR
jgi:hypothetical protein